MTVWIWREVSADEWVAKKCLPSAVAHYLAQGWARL